MDFIKWRSIERFTDISRDAYKKNISSMVFRAKIKLHGTNAGIALDIDGSIGAQSRSRSITVDNDNMGFADFVSNLKFETPDQNMIVYGEWAGPGIQTNDAITKIKEKTFFVFSILLVDKQEYVIEPEIIDEIIEDCFGDNPNIVTIGWFKEPVSTGFEKIKEYNVNFVDGSAQDVVDEMVADVDKIGEEDPFVKAEYGISAPGEGLVFYPENGDMGLLFKVKTVAHSVQKGPRNKVATAKPDGIDNFIKEFVTENRMKQILDEQFDGKANVRDTGKFIGAVMQDVAKESANEIEMADFDMKSVNKYAVVDVRNYFMSKV